MKKESRTYIVIKKLSNGETMYKCSTGARFSHDPKKALLLSKTHARLIADRLCFEYGRTAFYAVPASILE